MPPTWDGPTCPQDRPGRINNSQSGRLARIAGNSDGAQEEYLTSAPANPGPSARLVGGGDNADVVNDRR